MTYKIVTPVVTIFDENEKIDYEGNKKVIDFLIEGGVDGILVLGSTGEFTGMTYEEKRDFFKFYKDYVGDRLELYAGTGDMFYDEVVSLSDEVTDMGYAGVFVIGQYYYGTDQEKIQIYYDKLAKDTKARIYIYNFPARSGHSMDPATMARLQKDNPNIVGLKDSVMTPGHTNLCMRAVDDESFEIYSGFDDQFIYNIAAGGIGGIGALSNLVPEIWADLVAAANENNLKDTLKYQAYINALMPLYDMDSNFSYLFKILMKKRGLDINTTAVFPYNQIDESIVDEAWDLLSDVISDYDKA